MIISGWADGSLRGHNSVDGAEIFEVVDAHHGGVTCVAAAPLYIVTGGEDSTVRGSVWAVCGEEGGGGGEGEGASQRSKHDLSLTCTHTLFLSFSLPPLRYSLPPFLVAVTFYDAGTTVAEQRRTRYAVRVPRPSR